MIIYSQIEQLLVYAQAHLLLDDLDVIYVRNRLLTNSDSTITSSTKWTRTKSRK
ncbi:MAG: hypothetical protein ACLUSP_11045 [Christensenellales bacterium]